MAVAKAALPSSTRVLHCGVLELIHRASAGLSTNFAKAAGEMLLLFFYFQLSGDHLRVRPEAHGSTCFTPSSEGLDTQSAIPARLEATVQG